MERVVTELRIAVVRGITEEGLPNFTLLLPLNHIDDVEEVETHTRTHARTHTHTHTHTRTGTVKPRVFSRHTHTHLHHIDDVEEVETVGLVAIHDAHVRLREGDGGRGWRSE